MIKKEIIYESIDYILRHLNDDLTVDEIAAQFNYSKFYFCRSFKMITGESVYSFIKRLKIDQSAVDIKLEKNKLITDIGLDYGYNSSNFSSVFSKQHNHSPLEFRKAINTSGMANPFYPEAQPDFDTFEFYNSKIKIQELPDYFVVYERMIGNYYELKNKWFAFLDKYNNYIKEDTVLIERFYDDPAITDIGSCLYDICMTINESCGLSNVTTVSGGKYASYLFEGKIKDIFCVIQGIFSVWMPESGYVMDQRYGLNIYRAIDKENECVTMQLCIPIK